MNSLVRLGVGLEFNSLYHVKHAVFKVVELFYVWWRPFRFKSVSFFGSVIGVLVEKKEGFPAHTLN